MRVHNRLCKQHSILILSIIIFLAFASSSFALVSKNTGIVGCTDADGENPATLGSVNDLSTGAVNRDFCLNPTTLIEQTCLGDSASTKRISCPGGCSQGVCVPTKQAFPAGSSELQTGDSSCGESDAGNDPTHRGTITLQGALGTRTLRDYCLSQKTLIELSCDGQGGVTTARVPCPCSNGQCSDGSNPDQGAVQHFAPDDSTVHVPGRLIVRYRQDPQVRDNSGALGALRMTFLGEPRVATQFTSFNSKSKRYSLQSIETFDGDDSANPAYIVTFPDTLSFYEVRQALASDPNVLFADPVFTGSTDKHTTPRATSGDLSALIAIARSSGSLTAAELSDLEAALSSAGEYIDLSQTGSASATPLVDLYIKALSSPSSRSMLSASVNGGGSGACNLIGGSGTSSSFIMVPCGFDDANPSDVSWFESATKTMADTMLSVEPFSRNKGNIRIMRANTYTGKNYDTRTGYDVCFENPSTFIAAGLGCGTDEHTTKIIIVAKGCEFGGVTYIPGTYSAVCSGSSPADARNGGLGALHESGHNFGLFAHTDPPADLAVDNDPRYRGCLVLSSAQALSPNPNCADSGASGAACPEFSGSDYTRWIFSSDPTYGCFAGCDHRATEFRVWSAPSIMDTCSANIAHGFTPVEREALNKIMGGTPPAPGTAPPGSAPPSGTPGSCVKTRVLSSTCEGGTNGCGGKFIEIWETSCAGKNEKVEGPAWACRTCKSGNDGFCLEGYVGCSTFAGESKSTFVCKNNLCVDSAGSEDCGTSGACTSVNTFQCSSDKKSIQRCVSQDVKPADGVSTTCWTKSIDCPSGYACNPTTKACELTSGTPSCGGPGEACCSTSGGKSACISGYTCAGASSGSTGSCQPSTLPGASCSAAAGRPDQCFCDKNTPNQCASGNCCNHGTASSPSYKCQSTACSSSAPPCGLLGIACCTTTPACLGSTLKCGALGRCELCGSQGQQCCSGNACGSGMTCQNNVCQPASTGACTGPGQGGPCLAGQTKCSSDPTGEFVCIGGCYNWQTCYGGQSCGGLNQRCTSNPPSCVYGSCTSAGDKTSSSDTSGYYECDSSKCWQWKNCPAGKSYDGTLEDCK